MNGPGHYREAERLIEQARSDAAVIDPRVASMLLADAQVHATLALAAATALPTTSRWLGQDGALDLAHEWAEVSA